MRALVRGFTLLEILIAIVVLALGVIGGTAMQLAALRTLHQSTLLAQASYLAQGLAERMHANTQQMHLADGANPYLSLDYDALAEPSPAAPVLCYAGDCSSAQLAWFDLYEMKMQVHERLPAGRAVVCRDAALWAGGKLRWACTGGNAAPLVIKVGWRGKNPDGTPVRDDSGAYMPGVALVVGAMP